MMRRTCPGDSDCPSLAANGVEAVYDNFSANHATQALPRDMKWGKETTDETCITFVRMTVDAEQLGYRSP